MPKWIYNKCQILQYQGNNEIQSTRWNWILQNLYFYGQELFTLLPFFYSLQNYKITQRQWMGRYMTLTELYNPEGYARQNGYPIIFLPISKSSFTVWPPKHMQSTLMIFCQLSLVSMHHLKKENESKESWV